MPKVNIKIKMITNGEERKISLSGIKKDNTITYKDGESTISTDFLNKSITIDNNVYNIVLTFDINVVKILNYKLKKFNKELELGIKTNKLEVNDNSFIVDYELLDNDNIVTNVYYELYIGGLNG